MVVMIDGKKNGVEETYYYSHAQEGDYISGLKSRTFYENGVKNGLEEEYSNNRFSAYKVEHRCFYKNGVKEGTETYFDCSLGGSGVDGSLKYQGGKLHGLAYFSHLPSEFKQQNEALKNAGEGYNYFKDGDLVVSGYNMSERSFMDEKAYYKDGKLIARASRNYDKPDGYTYTAPNGKDLINPQSPEAQYIAEVDTFVKECDAVRGMTSEQEDKMIANIKAAEDAKSSQMALKKIQTYRKTVAKTLGLDKVKAPSFVKNLEAIIAKKRYSNKNGI